MTTMLVGAHQFDSVRRMLRVIQLLMILAVPSAFGQFSSLAAASYHTCGLLLSGYASCWGYNYDGQLGIDTSSVNMLSPVYPSGGHMFSSLASGWEHTCGVVTPGGVAYCWGHNGKGELGDGTQTYKTEPVPVSGGRAFSGLTGGEYYTCGVETPSGAAFCWGTNDYGQLGYSTTKIDDEWNDHSYEVSTAPGAVSGGYTFSSLAAGWSHTCGVLANGGAALCWGYNSDGELGDGSTSHRREPGAVSGGLAFSALAAGRYHTCGLVAPSGVAYCWGYNADGELGDGTGDTRAAPVPVSGGHVFSSIVAGHYHTCGLVASTGVARCWGNNDWAQMGDNTTGTSRREPVEVSGGHVFSALSAGWYHVCGVTTPDGAVVCWGYNNEGELGDGTRTTRRAPVSLSAPLSPTPTPSCSPSLTPSASNSPSQSQSPLITPSQAGTPSATPSQAGTPSATPSQAGTPSATPSQVGTPSATPSQVGTPSTSSSPSASPSLTQTVSQGLTASQSATGSTSGTQVSTGSSTQASTPSGTVSTSGTQVATGSSTQASTPSETPTPSPSGSGMSSLSPSATTSQTASLPSNSATASPSQAGSNVGSTTATQSQAATVSRLPFSESYTASGSATPSVNPVASAPYTASGTPTLAASATPSVNPVASAPYTASGTPTLAASATPSVNPVASAPPAAATLSSTPTQSSSVMFAVVQIGVGITIGGGLSQEVVTMPMVGIHLRSGLACIANVSLESVTMSSISVVNGSVQSAAVLVPSSHPVNTATKAFSPCNSGNDGRSSRRLSGPTKMNGFIARALVAGGSLASLDVGLTISVSAPSSGGSPQSSASVTAVLAALAPMLNASAANFSSGGSGGGSGGGAGGSAAVGLAFSSFASAAATASGSDPAAFQIGVSAQTAVLTVPSTSPTPSGLPLGASSAANTTAGLTGGAIAGIVIGVVVAIVLIVVVAILVSHRSKSLVIPRKGAVATPVADAGSSTHALGNVDDSIPERSREPRVLPPLKHERSTMRVVGEVQP